MTYDRQPRKTGETICLGGTDYYLDQLEGMGGSAIVYRGRYEDALSRGRYHQVLIRELFPWHPQGAVYRDEHGEIRCTEQGRKWMELSRRRFQQGNEVNLELLGQMPSRMSGNLNSYEAYGTYYSVLSVHGGETLETLLDEGRGPGSLSDLALMLDKILAAVECFHRKGLLHLDISPDNILLLPEQALLIDYNSVWELGQADAAGFALSVKEGYSAPELRLADVGELGYPADIYSVCAVFFHMLSGRPLNGEELAGNGLRRWLTDELPGLPVMENIPLSARSKTAQILTRGLHVLPRRRYQTAEELRNDLHELIDRINRAGISQAALWEAGREECRLRVKRPVAFLTRRLLLEERETSLPELRDTLERGACILLCGAGGIGKTWLLQKLWEEGSAGYASHQPAYFYLSLREYQEAGETPDYIRSALLRLIGCPGPDYGRRGQEENSTDSAPGMEVERPALSCRAGGSAAEEIRELGRLLSTRTGKRVRLVLLLDGLNEAGSQRRLLLKEIEALAAMPGVAILLSDRTDEVTGYALSSFRTSELLALDRAQVEEELEKLDVKEDGRESLFDLLANPMMLRLYRDILSMGNRAGGGRQESTEAKKTENDLIRAYLKSLGEAQLVLDSGDQALFLCHRYILEHLLPAIADEMSRRGKSLLPSGQLFGIAQRNYQMLRKKSFGRCFPEYLGKSRLMLRGIADEGEWFDFAVNEQLVGRMGLLVRGKSGAYRLIHDNFQECLTAAARRNKAVCARRKRRILCFHAAAAAAACVLSLGAGIKLTELHRHKKQEEALQTETFDLVEECLKENLVFLSSQIAAQKTLLDIAGLPSTLSGDENGLASFAATESGILSVPIERGALERPVKEALLRMRPQYPLNYLDYLCWEPVRMGRFMNSAILWLDQTLRDSYDLYMDEDGRRRMVEAYDEYLDAYAEYLFCVADYVIFCADPARVEGILDWEDAGNPWILEPYYLATGISAQSRKETERAIAEAKEKLEHAQAAMNDSGYEIDWEMLP